MDLFRGGKFLKRALVDFEKVPYSRAPVDFEKVPGDLEGFLLEKFLEDLKRSLEV